MKRFRLTFENVEKAQSGDMVMYGDRLGNISTDAKYSGGLKVGGVSLKYIIENYDNVFLLQQ